MMGKHSTPHGSALHPTWAAIALLPSFLVRSSAHISATKLSASPGDRLHCAHHSLNGFQRVWRRSRDLPDYTSHKAW